MILNMPYMLFYILILNMVKVSLIMRLIIKYNWKKIIKSTTFCYTAFEAQAYLEMWKCFGSRMKMSEIWTVCNMCQLKGCRAPD